MWIPSGGEGVLSDPELISITGAGVWSKENGFVKDSNELDDDILISSPSCRSSSM